MESINFKLIAEKCVSVLKDTVQNKNIYEIEIEEFSSNNSEIYITIGYSFKKFTGVENEYPFLEGQYDDPNDFIDVRKYRIFTIDRATLEIKSMGIREVNPRQNKYARVPTTSQA